MEVSKISRDPEPVALSLLDSFFSIAPEEEGAGLSLFVHIDPRRKQQLQMRSDVVDQAIFA